MFPSIGESNLVLTGGHSRVCRVACFNYNLDLDLAGFYSQFNQDQLLGPIIDRWRGMRPGHPSSLYEYLMIGIVLQNATIRRSIQMFQALLETYGQLLEYDGQRLWCFWQPGYLHPVSVEALRALKIASLYYDEHFFGFKAVVDYTFGYSVLIIAVS